SAPASTRTAQRPHRPSAPHARAIGSPAASAASRSVLPAGTSTVRPEGWNATTGTRPSLRERWRPRERLLYPARVPTAAILVIGNEILSGKVVDVNSPYLCRELRALGVDVERIATIPDDVDVIAREVRAMS